MNHPMKLFAGNASKQLAAKVADRLLIKCSDITVGSFSDGETKVVIDESVRGHDVFIIQSTCANTNQNIMELMIMVDAVKRSGAHKIYAIIPYFGYSRQDRKSGFSRTPITASLVANLLNTSGVDVVLTLDLHAQQIQGFFQNQIINMTAKPLIVADIIGNFQTTNPIVIVSPDVGGVGRAREIARDIGDGKLDLAIVEKRRPKENVSEVMNIIGDVSGKICIMIDDIVDTAGTLCKAADALTQAGAISVYAYCTHGVLSGSAMTNIANSSLTQLIITDTIPLTYTSENARAMDKIRVLSAHDIIANTIHRLRFNDSVSQQFE